MTDHETHDMTTSSEDVPWKNYRQNSLEPIQQSSLRSPEDNSEDTAIGDFICEKLLEHGYKEDEHYNLFFNHDWD